MVKHIGFIVGMIVIALLAIFFLVDREDQLLDLLVTTGPEMTLDEWREQFRFWAEIGIGVAALAAIAWFVLGQWGFNMNRWSNANNKRSVWLILGAFALAAALPGFLLTPAVQEWGRLAWPFYVANNLIVFYLSTVLLSPSSFKYTPWLSIHLRHFRQRW